MPGFGVDSGLSKSTNNSVQTAQKIGTKGEVTEMKTYGGMEEITETDYCGATFTNEAVNGQTGTTSSGVVTAHNLEEVAEDYAKITKTTQKPLAAGS